MKYPSLIWITALFLGWAFDFLFWRHAPGLNLTLYLLLLLGGGLLALLRNGYRPARTSLLLLVPILFFAFVPLIRREPLTVFLAGVLSLALLGLLAVTYQGGRWLRYGLLDYLVNFFWLAVSLLVWPLLFVVDRRREANDAAKDTRPRAETLWAMLRGVLIALPVLALFTFLLASADLVFAARLASLLDLFRLERLPEYAFRLFYILLLTYLLLGALLHAAQKSAEERLLEKSFLPPFLGFTEAAIVLGTVNLLFAFFVSIQFRYLFGGQSNIGLDGYTYAEYARRGFGELVIVAFLSLLLLLGLSAVTRRESATSRHVFALLGTLLVALVGVILVSAFWRLLLYENAYGFTRLRVYTHVSMLWLGLLLVGTVALEWLRRLRLFPLAFWLTALGFAATLLGLNVDGFIAHQNVLRALQGQELDVRYLAFLSADAVPTLAAALQEESLPAQTRDAVGAALLCQERRFGRSKWPSDWRSFTLSTWWAGLARQGVSSLLDDYVLYDSAWPILIETPLGQKFECPYGWFE